MNGEPSTTWSSQVPGRRDQGPPAGTRPCLVCEKPCSTEGQLCPTCVAEGHRVTDDQVIVNISVDLPDWMCP